MDLVGYEWTLLVMQTTTNVHSKQPTTTIPNNHQRQFQTTTNVHSNQPPTPIPNNHQRQFQTTINVHWAILLCLLNIRPYFYVDYSIRDEQLGL
jgi:hypothetical protein